MQKTQNRYFSSLPALDHAAYIEVPPFWEFFFTHQGVHKVNKGNSQLGYLWVAVWFVDLELVYTQC